MIKNFGQNGSGVLTVVADVSTVITRVTPLETSPCRRLLIRDCNVASVLKVLPLLTAFVRKTFAAHQNSMKTAKFFSRVAFVVYGI